MKHILDSNETMKKIYKSANEIVQDVGQPAQRTEICTLKNAIDVNIDGKLFCLAHIGQKKHKDAFQSCHSLNATLPLPENIKENTHFIESFQRLGIGKKMQDISTKIVLDVRRSSNKGIVSDFHLLRTTPSLIL